MASCSKGVSILIIVSLFILVPAGSQMTGGLHTIDVDDPDVKKYANFAVGQLNAVMNKIHYFKETDISEALRQIVEGLLYYLTIKISPTTCVNSGEPPENIQACELLKNSTEEPQICRVKVWVGVWLDPEAIMTNYQCTDGNIFTPCSSRKRRKRGLFRKMRRNRP